MSEEKTEQKVLEGIEVGGGDYAIIDDDNGKIIDVHKTETKSISEEVLKGEPDGKPPPPHADLPDSKFAEHVKHPEPRKKIIVLTITTSYGKRYTCRSVEELGIFFDNYKAEKKMKRDEDMNIRLGFGRMTEAEYARIPACKYFIKPK